MDLEFELTHRKLKWLPKEYIEEEGRYPHEWDVLFGEGWQDENN